MQPIISIISIFPMFILTRSPSHSPPTIPIRDFLSLEPLLYISLSSNSPDHRSRNTNGILHPFPPPYARLSLPIDLVIPLQLIHPNVCARWPSYILIIPFHADSNLRQRQRLSSYRFPRESLTETEARVQQSLP